MRINICVSVRRWWLFNAVLFGFLWGMRLLIRMWATMTGSVKSRAAKTKITSEAFPWRMETFCKWRLHVRLGGHGFVTEVEK